MASSGDGLALSELFGQIDIYVFDQILRGNIAGGMSVFDAGCGFGRNLVYLLRAGCAVHAVDANPEAVAHVTALAAELAPALPATNFRVEAIEAISAASESFDVVLCNSVLHFAANEAHFLAMLEQMWRVLKPGGLFFCRLGSRIGMDFEPVREHVYRIGDGSAWFLVSEAELMEMTRQMDAVLVDPLKTTVVQNYRCMTTWVLRKRR